MIGSKNKQRIQRKIRVNKESFGFTFLQLKNFSLITGKFSLILRYIVNQIGKQKTQIVLPCSLNDLATISRDRKVKKAYSAVSVATCDGMPLVLWSRIKVEIPIERVYGPDLMKAVLSLTQGEKYRHGFVGTTENVLEKLKLNILHSFPKLRIFLMSSLPFRALSDKELNELARKISQKKINVLWIGMSSPKQVQLASRLKPYLQGVSIFCVGAAFDFIAGTAKQAPLWMQKTSLEWLFRVVNKPRRLGKRYLWLIPSFLLHELVQNMAPFIKRTIKNFLVKAMLLFTSVVITLVIFELFFKVIGYKKRDHSWIFSNEEFIQNGSYRNFFTLDRFEIFKPKPNTVIIPDYWETDDRGFRFNPEHQSIYNPKYRILLIGDSFTYGHGVNHEEAWSYILEKELRSFGKDVWIDNAGVPATGTDQQFIRLKRLTETQHYDLVIWMVTFNDMHDSNRACLFKKMDNSTKFKQFSAILNVAYINGFLMKHLPKWYILHLKQGNYFTTVNYKGKDLYTLGCSKMTSDEEQMDPYFDKLQFLLKRTHSDLLQKKTNFVVLLGPMQAYFDPQFTNDSFEVNFLKRFINVFDSARVLYKNINEEIVSHSSYALSNLRKVPPLVLEDDTKFNQTHLNIDLFLDEGTANSYGGRHMNAQGNREIEKVIFDITNNNL